MLLFFFTQVDSVRGEYLIKFKNSSGEITATIDENGDLRVSAYIEVDDIEPDITSSYWKVIENDEIVFAIDMESGNAYSVGEVETNKTMIDSSTALWHLNNSAAVCVAAIQTGGDLQLTATVNGIINNIPLIPIPLTDLEPPNVNWWSIGNNARYKDGEFRIQSQPHAQGRILYNPTQSNGIYQDMHDKYDVSLREWRLKYKKGNDANDYNLFYGYRFRTPPEGAAIIATASATTPNMDLEYAYGNTNDPYDPDMFRYEGAIGYELDLSVIFNEGIGGNPDNVETKYISTNQDFIKKISSWPTFSNCGKYTFPISMNESIDPFDTYDDDALTYWYDNGLWYVPPDFWVHNGTDPCDCSTADPGMGAATTLWLYKMAFDPPASIPRKAGDPVTALGCTLVPSNVEHLEKIKLTIWDPSLNAGNRLWMRYWESFSWGSTPYEVLVNDWDGLLYADGDTFGVGMYANTSEVFMYADVYWDSTDSHMDWYESPARIEKPWVAFTFTGADFTGYDMEVGFDFATQVYTNDLDNVTAYQWDFGGTAFTITQNHQDSYTAADLLTAAALQAEVVNGKYITGAKSSVGGTDLGDREVTLTVTNVDAKTGAEQIETTHEFDLVVNRRGNGTPTEDDDRAKTTFYYAPYEENDGFEGQANYSITTDDGIRYVVEAWAAAVRMEGTGRIYKIRITPATSKETGDPPDEDHQYLNYKDGIYYFRDGVYGGIARPPGAVGTNPHPLVHQDGARYDHDPHKSYYNSVWSATNNGYKVVGLRQTVLDWIAVMDDDLPAAQRPRVVNAGETISVFDSGPFTPNPSDAAVLTDEKHLDVFVEPQGGTLGIHPDHFRELGEAQLRVIRE